MIKNFIFALIGVSAFATINESIAQTPTTTISGTIGSGPNKVAAVLPSANGAFKWASAAVIAGLRAAHARDPAPVTIELVETDDQLLETGSGLTDLYTDLAGRRSALVIGPLTRNSVNALTTIGRLPITTIALNQPDQERSISGNMIVFGLAIDSEAAQIARASYDEAALRIPTRRPLKALVVHNSTVQGKRAASAFIQTWQSLGGEILANIETDTKALSTDRPVIDAKADVIFAAVIPEALKGLRQSVGADSVIYGTSQINGLVVGGQLRANELNGIRLVDMPWQIQPDNMAVMAYPRASATQSSLEQQRLYALGIDSYRVMRELLGQRSKFEIDGVTGKLRVDLSQSQKVERNGLLAEFRRGVAVPIDGR